MSANRIPRLNLGTRRSNRTHLEPIVESGEDAAPGMTTDMDSSDQPGCTSTRVDHSNPLHATGIHGHVGGFKHYKFKERSKKDPKNPPDALLYMIMANELDLACCKIYNPYPQNLSKNERNALKELADNRDIIIKPADKGSAIVIMDTQDYIKEGDRQLSDKS